MSDPTQRYREILGLTENQYLDYKFQGQLDPAISKSLDQSFLEAAQRANIPADEFKEIFKGSPYVQNLIDRKASTVSIETYSLSMEARYRNLELQNIQASVVNKIKETAETAYKYVAYAEKALFAVTPLPLNAIKSGVQNVVIPTTATFALSRIPGVSDVVTTAIHLGESFAASATHAIAGSALAQFTNAATAMLPEGVNKAFSLNLPFVGQSMGGMISSASSAVVLGVSDVIGKAMGEVGVAVAVGKAVVEGAKAIASKGISFSFSELRNKSIGLSDKAQWVIDKSTELYNKGFKMENNGRAPEESTEAQGQEVMPISAGPSTGTESPEEQFVVEVNSAPVAKQEAEQPEPSIKPEVVGDKASEDYGFSIQQMLEQRGIQTDRMIINFDGQQKFKMEKGMESPLTNGLSAKDVEMLKQAMSDPDFKGSIKISKGGEVLFQRVGEGPPIIDGRQLYKPAIKLEYQSPAQLLHEQSSNGIESQGMKQVNDIALNAFRSGASTEEVKAALMHNEVAKGMDAKSLGAIVSAAKGAIALERSPAMPEKTAEKAPAMAK
jgi:hypothetical protein